MLRQHTAGVAAPKNHRAAACSTSAAVRQLVVERGHQGITNELVRHQDRCDMNRAASVLSAMTRRGEIHRAKVPGLPLHWFASAELAQRWKTATKPPEPATPKHRQRMVKMDRLREPTDAQNVAMVAPKAPPVVRIARRADNTDAPMIVPPGLEVQRVDSPRHDKRYQCAPDERPMGAGFAAAGIGRDITTGQAWGQRA